MKNPIPLLLVVAAGALMMSRKSARPNPEEIPTSLDYEDPQLNETFAKLEEDEENDEY